MQDLSLKMGIRNKGIKIPFKKWNNLQMVRLRNIFERVNIHTTFIIHYLIVKFRNTMG